MQIHFDALEIRRFLSISRASAARVQLPEYLVDESLWHPNMSSDRRETLRDEIEEKGFPESITYEDVLSTRIPVGVFLRASKSFAGIRPNVPASETASYNVEPWLTPKEWHPKTGFKGHRYEDYINREFTDEPITFFIEEKHFEEFLTVEQDMLNDPPGSFPALWPAWIEMEVAPQYAIPVAVVKERIWDLHKAQGLAVHPKDQQPFASN